LQCHADWSAFGGPQLEQAVAFVGQTQPRACLECHDYAGVEVYCYDCHIHPEDY
jgi:hypothetical protein